jgi:hypothetical protein
MQLELEKNESAKRELAAKGMLSKAANRQVVTPI